MDIPLNTQERETNVLSQKDRGRHSRQETSDTLSPSALTVISLLASHENIHVDQLKILLNATNKSMNLCPSSEKPVSAPDAAVSQHLPDVPPLTEAKPGTGTKWSPFSLRWFPPRLH